MALHTDGVVAYGLVNVVRRKRRIIVAGHYKKQTQHDKYKNYKTCDSLHKEDFIILKSGVPGLLVFYVSPNYTVTKARQRTLSMDVS